jgi:6,7-dimethyl-8-ribityllumazine synthase
MPKQKIQVNHIKGKFSSKNFRIGIVVARFNEYFTQKLLDGAIDTLCRSGVSPRRIDVYHVPGSFEIPLVVKKALKKHRYHAFITLGVVIKGQTRHFQHVVDAAAKGTWQVALKTEVPVIHGVISAQNEKQAIERTGGKMGHKGREAAQSALEMASLMKNFNGHA